MDNIPNPGSTELRMPWYVYWLKYKLRVRSLNKAEIHDNDVVFLGDSITEWNDWQGAFPEVKTHNFGIVGDTSYGVLARLHQITSGQPPGKIFLLIGTNDMFTYGRVSMEELLSNMDTILTEIRYSFPKTEVYVQSVMPRQPKFGDVIKELNRQVEELTERHRVTYIDLWGIMDDGTGRLRREYTGDNLHLNKKGKKVWNDYLRPFVTPGEK